MKRFVIGLFVVMMLVVWMLENVPFIWFATYSLVLMLLPVCYLVSSRAREFIDILLKVQKPTPHKRWVGGLLIFYIGGAMLVNGYREQQKRHDEEQELQLARVEVQSFLKSAKASIKAKDIKEALKFLRMSVSTKNATNYHEASKLFKQIQDVVIDHKVPQVLLHMTDREFVAFKEDGRVPNKVYFSDPSLNEVFLENLRKNRVRADTLREQELIRVEKERQRQAISKWRAEASTFHKPTLSTP